MFSCPDYRNSRDQVKLQGHHSRLSSIQRYLREISDFFFYQHHQSEISSFFFSFQIQKEFALWKKKTTNFEKKKTRFPVPRKEIAKNIKYFL